MLMVFGSINMDVSIPVRRLPQPGETLLGGAPVFSPGGKGANQAHAAQRFGVRTKLVGGVGEDGFAASVLGGLRLTGTDVRRVRYLEGCTTGLACISVAREGENAVVVAPGANALVRAHWVTDGELAACDSLLLQLEVPADESLALARRARQSGCRTLLNAAPWTDASLPHGLFDWVIVNAGQLRSLCVQLGLGTGDARDPGIPASRLAAALGCKVLVMLGDGGALIAEAEGVSHRRQALKVPALDTTGAEDTCVGVFAAALHMGMSEGRALEHAVAAGGLACTQRGAQTAQPTRLAVQEALNERLLLRA